jgi:phospholipase C
MQSLARRLVAFAVIRRTYCRIYAMTSLGESIPNHAGLMCAWHDARGAFEGQQELSLLVHHFQYTWKTPF